MSEEEHQDPSDDALVARVLDGETEVFEELITRYQGRVFSAARRYARRDSEIDDIAQEVFVKAFSKLDTFRRDAPFEHWLMRLAVRTCYDFLRKRQRSREGSFTDLSSSEGEWLSDFVRAPESTEVEAEGARALVERLLDMLSPAARLVIQLQEIEGKSVKEIAEITGWSVSLVKVRAFRARNEMRRCVAKIPLDKYL